MPDPRFALPLPTPTATPTEAPVPGPTATPKGKATPTPNAAPDVSLAAADIEAAATDDPFQEAGGQVVMEAEHAHANIARGGQAWTPNTDRAGYVAEGFMTALPDNGTVVKGGYPTKSCELRFEVEFATPGTYRIWLRALANGEAMVSVHVGLDGLEVASAREDRGSRHGTWRWTAAAKSGVATITVPSAGRTRSTSGCERTASASTGWC